MKVQNKVKIRFNDCILATAVLENVSLTITDHEDGLFDDMSYDMLLNGAFLSNYGTLFLDNMHAKPALLIWDKVLFNNSMSFEGKAKDLLMGIASTLQDWLSKRISGKLTVDVKGNYANEYKWALNSYTSKDVENIVLTNKSAEVANMFNKSIVAEWFPKQAQNAPNEHATNEAAARNKLIDRYSVNEEAAKQG